MDIAYREVRDRVARARPELPDDVVDVKIQKHSGDGIPIAFYGIRWPEEIDERAQDLIERHFNGLSLRDHTSSSSRLNRALGLVASPGAAQLSPADSRFILVGIRGGRFVSNAKRGLGGRGGSEAASADQGCGC